MKRAFRWFVVLLHAALVAGACDGESKGGDDGGTCQKTCSYYHECDTNEDCVAGCCHRSKRCSQDATCRADGAKCVDGRCVGLCVNDTDCPTMSSCVYGFCEPYPEDVHDALTAPPPDQGRTERTALRVGIGDVPLDFPIGVSMAGFGGRRGPHNPYRKTLGGSDSVWDKPRVKAFVFDNGLRRIALVRTATCWTTDYMASHAAWRLFVATGDNYLDRLVLSANHSHSYPARFSYWLPHKSFGVMGHGDFSREIFERQTEAIADAVLAAIEDLQPARFGYTFVDPMDPEHGVHHDRRGNDQDPMDDSLVVMRIDDADGNPRAVLFDFALHGTFSGDTTVTGDAPGAVEIIAERNLQELTGLPVKACFLSGNSGDVAPTGGVTGLDNWRQIQQVGHRAWPIIQAQFEALEGLTTSDVELDIANRRVPINRQVLGYGPGVFVDDDGQEFLFGAFQCVSSGDHDPETMYEDGALGCIFSAEMLSDGLPVPQFCKARLSVLRIGDLGLVTSPGESLGVYGRDVARALLDEGFAHAGVLGYSQDHHFYLMHADNWLQGGYEPSMVIWGWAEADYFLQMSHEMIHEFATSGGYTDDAGMMPSWFTPDDDTVPPTATDPSDAGEVLLDAPAAVERISRVILQWTGGHPGVHRPVQPLRSRGLHAADYSRS